MVAFEDQFFGAVDEASQDSRAVLNSIDFEGPGNCREGAGQSFRHVKRASHLLETYVPKLGRDFADLKVADEGVYKALNWQDISEFAHQQFSKNDFSIFLGGDHTISGPIVEALYRVKGPFNLLVFDAHLDAYDQYGGSPHAHATWARRAGECLGDGKIWFVGHRAYTREEERWAMDHQRLLPLHQISLENATRTALAEMTGPLYVSIDIDVLDPSYAPGVGNPESGGCNFEELEKSLSLIARSHHRGATPVLGFDLVEVIGEFDPANITGLRAAELVRNFTLELLDKEVKKR